jgi:hypothetical protein
MVMMVIGVEACEAWKGGGLTSNLSMPSFRDQADTQINFNDVIPSSLPIRLSDWTHDNTGAE